MNSKGPEDSIKFTRGLVYCGQTTGVTSMGTRTQNPGVQSSPAWVFMAAPYSTTGCSSPFFGIHETSFTVYQIPPHTSAPQVYLNTHLKEKIIEPLNITLLREQGLSFLFSSHKRRKFPHLVLRLTPAVFKSVKGILLGEDTAVGWGRWQGR